MKPLQPIQAVVRSELYEEVMSMALLKGVDVTFFEKDGIEQSAFTSYPSKKEINVVFNSSEVNKEELYIHELLHVKLSILGYPGIKSYNLANLPPWVKGSINSLANTVDHIYIFKEMKKRGYTQKELDTAFLEDVIRTIDMENVSPLSHAVNFLEMYIRDEDEFEKKLDMFATKQKEGFCLFESMKSLINGIHMDSPVKMRELLIGLLRLAEDFIIGKTGQDLNIRLVYSVNPGYPEVFLDTKSSTLLYSIELENYPCTFVLDKIYNQSCFFITDNNGGKAPKSLVDEVLEEYTLRQVISYFS